MIYAAIVGVLLGLDHAPWGIAIPVIVGLVAFKGIIELVIKKNPITGTPSPYVLYVENLQKAEPLTVAPWRGYLVQVMLFGVIVGIATYGLCRLVL
ncbi:MAG: hypothetical protein M0R70_01845 [Nitrospirae bacterium]|nr:hypothetical protein [Nitrospirota bacterium]